MSEVWKNMKRSSCGVLRAYALGVKGPSTKGMAIYAHNMWATKATKKLVAAGLVEVVKEDGKRNKYTLTRKGRAVHAEIETIRRMLEGEYV